jgi:choice-of-anchor C domain-containing protein
MNLKLLPILILGFTPALLHANLLFNGSFETNGGGACVPTSFITMSPGNTCISGWSIVSGNVDYISSVGGWEAEDGTFSIDMSGTVNGAIEQSFATVVGQGYSVTFWMAGNFGAAPVVKTLQVSAAGQSQNDTFDTTGKSDQNMGWVMETFNFVAANTSTTLEFANIDVPNSDGGPTLDNVSVTATAPEPGSFALLFVALGGMAFTRLIRRA